MDTLDINRYVKRERERERQTDGACGKEVNKISGKIGMNRLVDKSGVNFFCLLLLYHQSYYRL
jgi:hypothetical protein